MDKRKFLMGAGAAACTAAGAVQRQLAPSVPTVMQVLTVAGRIGRSNRGPLDPVHDQLMKKHGLAFERAFTFGLTEILRMASLPLQPTLEFDGKPHVLRGPSLVNVLTAAGVDLSAPLNVGVRALDGYRVVLPMTQVRDRSMILATHLDDQPLSFGGLGPLWAVFDPDGVPALRDKPHSGRYGECPWGVYFIDVTP